MDINSSQEQVTQRNLMLEAENGVYCLLFKRVKMPNMAKKEEPWSPHRNPTRTLRPLERKTTGYLTSISFYYKSRTEL